MHYSYLRWILYVVMELEDAQAALKLCVYVDVDDEYDDDAYNDDILNFILL